MFTTAYRVEAWVETFSIFSIRIFKGWHIPSHIFAKASFSIWSNPNKKKLNLEKYYKSYLIPSGLHILTNKCKFCFSTGIALFIHTNMSVT